MTAIRVCCNKYALSFHFVIILVTSLALGLPGGSTPEKDNETNFHPVHDMQSDKSSPFVTFVINTSFSHMVCWWRNIAALFHCKWKEKNLDCKTAVFVIDKQSLIKKRPPSHEPLTFSVSPFAKKHSFAVWEKLYNSISLKNVKTCPWKKSVLANGLNINAIALNQNSYFHHPPPPSTPPTNKSKKRK